MPRSKPKPKRPPKPRGRKPEITEAQMVSLETLLSNHNSILTACHLTGVHPASYHRWCGLGDEPDAPAIYREFRDRMIRARTIGKANLIKAIADHGKTDWRALAFLGERIYPDELRAPEKLEVTHSGTVNHEHKAIIVNIPKAISEPRPLPPQIDARKTPDPAP